MNLVWFWEKKGLEGEEEEELGKKGYFVLCSSWKLGLKDDS